MRSSTSQQLRFVVVEEVFVNALLVVLGENGIISLQVVFLEQRIVSVIKQNVSHAREKSKLTTSLVGLERDCAYPLA